MKTAISRLGLAAVLAAILILPVHSQASAQGGPVQTPVFLWQNGGCFSWCETGWYSSPAVADINHDGNMEVIGASYSVFALNGTTGATIWRVPTGKDITAPVGTRSNLRTWPGVVVADVDADGQLEIVTATSGGYISVYNATGRFESGWPQKPVTEEFRSLSVADLDHNGEMEIVAGRARLDEQNIWVYNANGTLRSGWPQLAGAGSAAGIYNDNIAIGDLVPGGDLEIVAPSDTITIAAYDDSGNKLGVNPIYHDGHDINMLTWAEVPAYVNPQDELTGYGPCYEQFTARANFADGPADIVDVNGDGINEVVSVGNVHNCNTDPYANLYNTPFIFNADRSRFQASGFDWSTPPQNTGAPLSESYDEIETAEANPVTVDLDGDGKLEILYASYDGKVHAFWLDKTEHGNWPFSVYHTGDPYLAFASEPVVADLNGDGLPEIIFSTWVEKGSYATGKLYILDHSGNQLQAVYLPSASGDTWNGALAAPTLADINGDGNLEVVLNTAATGLVAYTLPGTQDAEIIWGTGRGSYLRNGSLPWAQVTSKISADRITPKPGDLITLTISLQNPGFLLTHITLTDDLPSELVYSGNPIYPLGTDFNRVGNHITWSGSVPIEEPLVISFQATLASLSTTPYIVTNSIKIEHGSDNVISSQVMLVANGRAVYMPVIKR